jgi:hypothetical protein
LTFSWLSMRNHPEYQTGQSGFPGSGQDIDSRELTRQMILDSATVKFRRPASSSIRLSYDALLFSWATNAWAVGISTNDVPALSTWGRVVQTMGSTTDALPPEMVRTNWGFWLRRLLCKRWPLWMRRPPIDSRILRQRIRMVQNPKPDCPASQEATTAPGC